MNEITTIHIGRQPFKIAVDAYKELQNYLSAIKRQVGKQKDVLEEVEMRMAELLHERGINDSRVIMADDIAFLQRQLGQPGDFKEEAEAREEYEAPGDTAAPKRLYRDTDRAMFAGVAAGLAAYFGIDAVFIRILFVVATISGGWGILLYGLMWLIVPEAKTPSEQLQMRGKRVTVDGIKEVIENADVKGAATRVGDTATKAVSSVLKVLAALVAMALIVAGAATLLAELTLGTYLLIHGVQVNNELVFPVGGQEVFLTACAFTMLAVFGLLLILAGTAHIRRKWSLPGWATVVLVALFFASAGVGAATAADSAPNVSDRIHRLEQTTNLDGCQENLFNHCTYDLLWKQDNVEYYR